MYNFVDFVFYLCIGFFFTSVRINSGNFKENGNNLEDVFGLEIIFKIYNI